MTLRRRTSPSLRARETRKGVRAVAFTGVVVVAVLVGYLTCAIRFVLPWSTRALNALKNRTALPAEVHIDATATLDALLAPGEDVDRWSQDRAAVVDGYVVRVVEAGVETANCLSLTRRDTHVELALHPEASPTERLIAEVTPPLRDRVAREGKDWSTAALARDYLGRRVRVTGWLMFDRQHELEAENFRPGHLGSWRRTAWEIHPITSIEVLESAR